MGLGVDLVEIDRVARAQERWGARFAAKLMDPDEEALLPAAGPERVLALARAIAAKEATSKAIGTGWSRGVRWRDVVLVADPTPSVVLRGRAAAVARALGSDGRTRILLEVHGNLVVSESRLLG